MTFMKKEINELLSQILANQVVIYKRLEDIEKSLKGGTRTAPLHWYIDELKAKAEEVRELERANG
jgi:hypothetical protein